MHNHWTIFSDEIPLGYPSTMYNTLAPNNILNPSFQMILPDLIMSVLRAKTDKTQSHYTIISIQIDAKKRILKGEGGNSNLLFPKIVLLKS